MGGGGGGGGMEMSRGTPRGREILSLETFYYIAGQLST